MKTKKNNFSLFIGIFLTFVLIITGIWFFNFIVNTELEESITTSLNDVSNQQILSINREFSTERTIIQNISKTLSVIGYNEASIIQYLATLETDFSFENVFVVDPSGVGIITTGEIVDISEFSYFETALNGELVTSSSYLSPFSGNLVVAVASPVYYEGKIDGVVAAEYNLDYLISLLSISGGENGDALILQNNGEVVVSTNASFHGFNDILNLEFTDNNNLNDFVADINNSKAGNTSFILDGEDNIAVYHPLEINNWTAVFIVSGQSIHESANSISQNMILLSTLIILCFLLILVYFLMQKKKNMEIIEKIAYFDDLTGLPNLIKFKLEISKILNSNKNADYALVKMDIVNFKAVNELFDFEIGNRVLNTIADVINESYEIPFIAARTGSDEFMIFSKKEILLNDELLKGKERIFKEKIPELASHQFSFRYGRYEIAKDEYDINDIVNKATMAHSYAKNDNINSICDYNEQFKKRIVTLTELTNKKDDALKNGDFKVFYQPKFKLSNNELIGAEALVRWIEPDGNMIFPNDFIPLFESNGFIINLDLYMLECVCISIKKWLDNGKNCVPVSVNFSKLHLKNPNFIHEIKSITDKYNIPRKFIEIELTETTITENEKELEKLLMDLHNNGFSVSIDDFGSGYSSLGMLKNFKVDTLKLDRSFFVNSLDDDRGNLVVDGIIKIAHKLQMYTVAEGVELADQAEFLKEIECESAQGYLYEKPISTNEFEEKYL